MKTEQGVFGEGGAAFLGMRCMAVAGNLKSSGSLNSGTGELSPKNRATWRGPAGSMIAGILETAAGELTKAPVEAEKARVTFLSEFGIIRGTARVSLTVIKNNGPASLIVSALFGGDDGCPKLADLAQIHGREGAVIIEPEGGDQGDLLEGDVAPVVLIHGKGIETVQTQAHGTDLYEVIQAATLNMRAAETAATQDPNQPAIPGVAKVIRRSGKDLAANQGTDDDSDWDADPEQDPENDQ